MNYKLLMGIFGIIVGIFSFISAIYKKNLISKDGPEITGTRRIFIFVMSIVIFLLGIITLVHAIM